MLPESPHKPRGRPPKVAPVPSAAAGADAPQRYRAPALDKGLDILELLSTQPQGLTRAQIVKEIARSPNEIYRMLERLVVRQYVTRSVGGDRYALSLKLFAMAHAHPPLSRLVNQALPVMEDFARRIEQPCQLGVHDRGRVLTAAQADSPGGWGFSLRPGARVGLLDTASGYVLLAFADPDTRQRMLAEQTALGGGVPTTPANLDALLASVRAQGYLERASAQSFGVVDMACPVLGPYNVALAVLSCHFTRRLDRPNNPDVIAARAGLQHAARALSFEPGPRGATVADPAQGAAADV